MKRARKILLIALMVTLMTLMAVTLVGCARSEESFSIDVDSIINTAVPVILTAVIIPLLVSVGNAIKNSFKEKVKNEKLQKYFDYACDAAVTAVAEVMQTFVTTIKDKGEWTDETAAEALNMAMLKAKELIGVAALQALPDIVGDVDTWLRSKIEAATLAAKTNTAGFQAQVLKAADA